MTTYRPFFLFINTSDFLFALRFAIGTCMLQLRISVNKNLEHVYIQSTVYRSVLRLLQRTLLLTVTLQKNAGKGGKEKE
jgi:hypothetical protein